MMMRTTHRTTKRPACSQFRCWLLCLLAASAIAKDACEVENLFPIILESNEPTSTAFEDEELQLVANRPNDYILEPNTDRLVRLRQGGTYPFDLVVPDGEDFESFRGAAMRFEGEGTLQAGPNSETVDCDKNNRHAVVTTDEELKTEFGGVFTVASDATKNIKIEVAAVFWNIEEGSRVAQQTYYLGVVEAQLTTTTNSAPTAAPTIKLTLEPTSVPTTAPTSAPTTSPTTTPTTIPTTSPTLINVGAAAVGSTTTAPTSAPAAVPPPVSAINLDPPTPAVPSASSSQPTMVSGNVTTNSTDRETGELANTTSVPASNATSASDTNATSASDTNVTSTSDINATSASGTNATSASDTNVTSTSDINATSASGTNASSVPATLTPTSPVTLAPTSAPTAIPTTAPTSVGDRYYLESGEPACNICGSTNLTLAASTGSLVIIDRLPFYCVDLAARPDLFPQDFCQENAAFIVESCGGCKERAAVEESAPPTMVSPVVVVDTPASTPTESNTAMTESPTTGNNSTKNNSTLVAPVDSSSVAAASIVRGNTSAPIPITGSAELLTEDGSGTASNVSIPMSFLFTGSITLYYSEPGVAACNVCGDSAYALADKEPTVKINKLPFNCRDLAEYPEMFYPEFCQEHAELIVRVCGGCRVVDDRDVAPLNGNSAVLDGELKDFKSSSTRMVVQAANIVSILLFVAMLVAP